MTDTPSTRIPLSVYALAAINFAVGTQGFVFAGLVADMARDLGVTVGQTGWLVAGNAIVFACVAPLAAQWTASFERRGTIVRGLVVLALINALCAAIPSFEPLLALRIIAGLTTAVVAPLATVTATQLVAPEQRGRAFAIVMAGITLAFLVGVPAGSAIGGSVGWRASFVFAAAVVILAALVVALSLPRVPGQNRATSTGWSSMRLPAVWSALASTFLSFTATFTVVSFIGPIAHYAVNAEGRGIGMLQAFIGIGSIIGLVIGGRSADKGHWRLASIAAFALISASSALYSPMLIGQFNSSSYAALAALLVIGAAALFALIPINLSRIAEAAGSGTPMALALNGSLISLGQGIGAVLGGILLDRCGLPSLPIAGAIVALVPLLLLLFVGKRSAARTER